MNTLPSTRTPHLFRTAPSTCARTCSQRRPFTKNSTTSPRGHAVTTWSVKDDTNASSPSESTTMIETLRAEVDARTAAMTNLQSQVEHIEALRGEELDASIARFKELDSALSLAEGTISALEKRVEELESENTVLKETLASEMHAATELLLKAEALATAMQQQKTNNQESATVDNGALQLSEADAEALLDEMDLLRAEIESSENEAQDLRKQVIDKEREFSQRLAAVKAEAATATAESKRFESELIALREKFDAAVEKEKSSSRSSNGSNNGMSMLGSIRGHGFGSGTSNNNTTAKDTSNEERLRVLEAENAALEAALAQGRAFLEAALKQQSALQ